MRRYFRGQHVTSTEDGRWWFHACLCCGRPLPGTRNQTGFGNVCWRRVSERERDRLRRGALQADRGLYRSEQLFVR